MLPVRTLHCVEQWHAIAQRSKRLGKGVDLIGNTVDIEGRLKTFHHLGSGISKVEIEVPVHFHIAARVVGFQRLKFKRFCHNQVD